MPAVKENEIGSEIYGAERWKTHYSQFTASFFNGEGVFRIKKDGSVLSLVQELRPGRLFLCRLDHNSEIVGSIASLAKALGIEAGAVSAIGALKRAEIGYYDQVAHEYRAIEIDHPMEITSLIGNISTRDGKPFLHAHATLADSEGNVRGGHLSSGTVFAAEVYLRELLGRPLVRIHDPTTDLFLWSEND